MLTAGIVYDRMYTMNIQDEVKEVEKELLDIIVKNLEESKIDVTTAKKLAQDFLSILPISDQHDLLLKLKQLSDKYTPVKEVYVEELAKVSNLERDQALSSMRDAIKKGDIENAIQVAKTLESKSS